MPMPYEQFSDNDYFKMGAAVAVGELYVSGRLGNADAAAAPTRRYLESFGLRSMADIRRLGITGPYAEDFERLYQKEASAHAAGVAETQAPLPGANP